MSDPATIDAALGSLVQKLDQVRSAYDAEADGWEPFLLGTFAEFCREIGVEGRLIDPILSARYDRLDVTLRRREEREARAAGASIGPPRKASRAALALTMAAAAVTVLKERGDCASITDAEREVAKLSGIDRKKIRAFRNSILSSTATPVAIAEYPRHVAELKSWPTPLELGRLAGFLKNPRSNHI